MSNAEKLREAIKTFKEGAQFSKEQVKERAVNNGYDDKYFHRYFNDLKNGIKGIKVVDDGEGLYHWESISKETHKRIAKTSQKKPPKVDYSKMIETKNNKGRFKRAIKKLKLDVDCGFVVLLTKKNSGIIEKTLEKDLCYVPYTNVFINDTKIKRVSNKKYDRQTIMSIVRIIDIENGTQQWLNERGRNRVKRMVEFIINKENKFWPDLNKGEPSLVDRLNNAAIAGEGKNIKGKDFDGPKSLASKVCKYLSLFVLGKDNYYVNDKFVRKVLRYYFRYYLNAKITKVDKASYSQLHEWLSELHNCDKIKEEGLSKHFLDHLMWYPYKNSRGTFINEKSKKPSTKYYDL